MRAPTVSAPRGTQKAVGLVLTGSLLSRLLYKAIDSNGENVGPIYNYRAKGHCHPRASSAKTRGFHTQLDEGPETP